MSNSEEKLELRRFAIDKALDYHNVAGQSASSIYDFIGTVNKIENYLLNGSKNDPKMGEKAPSQFDMNKSQAKKGALDHDEGEESQEEGVTDKEKQVLREAFLLTSVVETVYDEDRTRVIKSVFKKEMNNDYDPKSLINTAASFVKGACLIDNEKKEVYLSDKVLEEEVLPKLGKRYQDISAKEYNRLIDGFAEVLYDLYRKDHSDYKIEIMS